MFYKKVKFFFLLCALCTYGQGSMLATEPGNDTTHGVKRSFEAIGSSHSDMDVDTVDRESKRPRKPPSLENSPSNLQPLFSEKTILEEVFLHLNLNSLLNFSASAKFINRCCNFEKAIQGRPYYPWKDYPKKISFEALYTMNKFVLQLLGLHINISRGWAEARDRIFFESVCDQFTKHSFYDPNALPAKYINLLRVHLACHSPFPPQGSLEDFLVLGQKIGELAGEFKDIFTSSEDLYTNERALYLHYIQFVLLNNSANQVESIKNSPPFHRVDNLLMTAVDKNFLALKAQINGNPYSSNSADQWRQIINREPHPTTWQLSLAAASNHNRSLEPGEPAHQARYAANAVRYRERQISMLLQSSGQTPPTTWDYEALAQNYSNAVRLMKGVNVKGFARSAMHYEHFLKLLKDAGETPTALQYRSASEANNFAGQWAQDENKQKHYYLKADGYKRESTRDTSRPSLLDLPDSVLLNILIYKGVAKSTGTVCTTFEELRKDREVPLFFVMESVDRYNFYINDTISWTRPKLIIWLDNGDLLLDNFLSTIGSLSNLTHLELGAIRDCDDDLELNDVASAIGSLTNLTYLALYADDFSDYADELPEENDMARAINNLPNLTYLHINNYDPYLPEWTSALNNIPKLTHLVIGYAKETSLVVRVISNFPNLAHLYLYEGSAEILAPNIGLLTKLRRLDLSGGHTRSREEMKLLAPELGKLTNLTDLDLSNHDDYGYFKGAGILASELGKLPNLMYLNLGRMEYEKGEIQILASELLKLAHLIHLDLKGILPQEKSYWQEESEWKDREEELQILALELSKLPNLASVKGLEERSDLWPRQPQNWAVE